MEEKEKIKEIIENIKPNRKAYNKTEYILKSYIDLKNGAQLIETPREIIELIDRTIELLEGDNYIDLIKKIYIEGKSVDEISRLTNLDERTIYRQKKRIIKRMSVILYGDEALKE